MLALMLAACTRPALQIPEAPLIGSPEASQSARPDWIHYPGYAPGLEQEQLAAFTRAEHTGTLRGALLVCEATTTHQGDRRRRGPARRGINTALPDMDATLYLSELGVETHGPTNRATVLLGAPSVALSRGDSVKILLEDRGFFRSVVFDTLHGEYDGALPLSLSGAKSEATCWQAPRAQVEAQLAAALAAADGDLARLEERSVDLEASDFGQELTPDPRASLDAAAALVGWSHPEVTDRLDRIRGAEADFREQIASLVAEEAAGAAEEVVVEGSVLRLRRASCPRPLGYWRHRFRAECALELDAVAGDEGLPSMELVFGDGLYWKAYPWSVPAGAHALTEATAGALEPGEEGTMMIRYTRDQQPIAVRILSADGVQWLPVVGRE